MMPSPAMERIWETWVIEAERREGETGFAGAGEVLSVSKMLTQLISKLASWGCTVDHRS